MPRPAATAVAGIVAGALPFAWPALLNRYPLVFSDTWGYIDQGYEGVSWDKPWIYGPLIRVLAAGTSLWPVVPAQALLLSAMLWLAQRTLLPPAPAAAGRTVAHVLLCLVLAALTAAPWFASQVMPDSLTPLAVLGVAILGLGHPRLSRPGRVALMALTALLIAAHFSHVAIAAACVAALGLPPLLARRWRPLLEATWRPAASLAAALALILATNVVGRGQVAISPAGPVFILARLVADGPAADYLEAACPAAGYHLCEWKGRFPTDSDAFLWSSDGPLYKDDYGAPRLAPEAAEIVRRTAMAYPGRVLALAARNTLRQLAMVRLGDAIAPDHLATVLRDTVAARFPPAELSRFDASLQLAGRLLPVGEALNPVLLPVLVLAAAGTLLLAAAGWRRHPALAAFALLVLAATVANALTTGALSTPHDRYEARLAWLLLLPPALALAGRLMPPAVSFGPFHHRHRERSAAIQGRGTEIPRVSP